MIPRKLPALLALAVMACSEGERSATPAQPPPDEDPVARLPAAVVGPNGDSVDIGADSAAVVYLWLPIKGHRPTERDLRALDRITETGRARVLPIQLTAEARNAAQTQVNGLELSMPVYRADSCILQSMDQGHLPSVLLIVPGSQSTATGFGAVSRLLLHAENPQ